MIERDAMLERVIQAILVEYLAIYYVDLETDRYEHFSRTAAIENAPETDFFKSCQIDAEKYVYAEDRERFIERLSKE